jgi:hypothetical protein
MTPLLLPPFQGDLNDLCTKFSNCLVGKGEDTPQARPWRGGYGHCSALVKPVRDAASGVFTELFSGHTTWAGFESMTRAFKHYDFALTGEGGAIVPGRHSIFSGYPSCAVSTGELSRMGVGGGCVLRASMNCCTLSPYSDDWYQLAPSNLAVFETTIDNNNASLWDAVTPQTVPYWIRNQVQGYSKGEAQRACAPALNCSAATFYLAP